MVLNSSEKTFSARAEGLGRDVLSELLQIPHQSIGSAEIKILL